MLEGCNAEGVGGSAGSGAQNTNKRKDPTNAGLLESLCLGPISLKFQVPLEPESHNIRRLCLYYTILYYTILYYTILYYTILYYTILYYTILYYTILYYTILYYTILYCTVLYCLLNSWHPLSSDGGRTYESRSSMESNPVLNFKPVGVACGPDQGLCFQQTITKTQQNPRGLQWLVVLARISEANCRQQPYFQEPKRLSGQCAGRTRQRASLLTCAVVGL